MGLRTVVYDLLPSRLQPIASVAHQQLVEGEADAHDEADFVDTFFENEEEWARLRDEPGTVGIPEIVEKSLDQYDELTAEAAFGSADSTFANACYSLVRTLKPTTVVETGVCNGVTTLFLLKALAENERGHLYSVDYPYRADEDLEAFRNETFREYGGAAIPSDKQPGWIVPDDLRRRWDLRVGRSQILLPSLLEEVKEVDLFIHDSEHSHPCMMFEYEAVWHRMAGGGAILSDDINWNHAFDVFCEVRKPVHGTLNSDVGFMLKPRPEQDSTGHSDRYDAERP